MQSCRYCSQHKPDEEFYRYSNDVLSKTCLSCRDIQQAGLDKNITPRRWRIERCQIYVYDYLLLHPCVDCGESDPIVLEFDHIDPSIKKSAISRLVRQGISIQSLQKEIDKCEVRCSNCHKRRTAKQTNCYRLQMSNEYA